MAYGELIVYWADGTVRSFPIDKATISIGRAPGNDIVLPTPAASRYHAHINADEEQVHLVDLGTVNGTFLNDDLLTPQAGVELSDGYEIRIGDVRLVYRVEGASVPALGAVAFVGSVEETQPMTKPTGLLAFLDEPHQSVAPGARLQLALLIQNATDEDGLYDVSFYGEVSEWARANRREVRLKAHERTEVMVSVRPPRTFRTKPGNYELRTSVAPRDDPSKAVIQSRNIEVVGFHGFGMVVHAAEQPNQFDVIIQNQGNVLVKLQLGGWHAEQSLKYQFSESRLSLEPGETRRVSLQVRARRSLNTQTPTTFAVVARSLGASGYQAPVPAVFSGHSGGGAVPGLWAGALVPILFAAVVLGIVGLAVAFFLFGPDDTDQSESEEIAEELATVVVELPTATIVPTQTPEPTAIATQEPQPDSGNSNGNGESLSQTNEQGYNVAVDSQQHTIIEIPPGTFSMGTPNDQPGGDNERPLHEVTFIESFWIDQFEVTNGQYIACVQTETCEPPRLDLSQQLDGTPVLYGNPDFNNHPVLFVDWQQAQTFCQWRGGRLPSEAEWEYAARGEDVLLYPWGDDAPNFSYVNFGRTVGPLAVGTKPAGISPFGLHDMAGNAWEWVADWYDPNYYETSPAVNPLGPSSPDDITPPLRPVRVVRGGSWADTSEGIRVANREWLVPLDPDFNFSVGFRCVSTPATP